MSELRMGLVGCGYWGPNLLRNFDALPLTKVVALADRSRERRTFVEEKYPAVRLYEDAAQIFADSEIDAVSISTPADSHAMLVKAALEAGKHVFVEKPLSLTSAEGLELVACAEARGLTLMVGHTFLFNEAVRDLKRRMDAGELGKIHYLYGQRLNLGIVRADVDAAWNLAPHDISIGNYLLGEVPTEVSATGVRALQPEHGLSDVVFMSLRYPSGVTMQVHVSWLDPRKTRQITVVGDQKMIIYDDVASDKIAIYDRGVVRGDAVPMEQPTDFARFKMVVRAGDLTVPNLKVPEPLSVQCRHFAECVLEKKQPLTDGMSGVAVTAVLEAVSRSVESGGKPEKVSFGG